MNRVTELADWADNVRKGAFVEIEGELRYREYTPAESYPGDEPVD